MKKIIPVLILALCIPALACTPGLSSEKAKYSYSFGYQIGSVLKSRPMFNREDITAGMKDALEGRDPSGEKSRQIGHRLGKSYKDQGISIDMEVFTLGVNDGYEGTEPKIARNVMSDAVSTLQRDISEKNLKAGSVYLAANKKKEGVVVTASGLQYRILVPGNGQSPRATDKVRVHYTGKLINGEVFDSSIARNTPAEFVLNQVIKGWTEGVQLMKVGSKYEFAIPSDLGYGPRGAGSIPGNSVLIFEVELLGILR